MNTKSDFLTEWMRSQSSEKPATRKFSNTPKMVPFADMDYWYLTTPFSWKPNDISQYELPDKIEVPAGFVTDFASIPSIFWTVMPRTGRYGFPAIIHDWLYWDQPINKHAADRVFQMGLHEMSVSLLKRKIMTASVHMFGGNSWDNNSAEKTQGQGRVIKKYPNDPRTTWEEWKNQENVFK